MAVGLISAAAAARKNGSTAQFTVPRVILAKKKPQEKPHEKLNTFFFSPLLRPREGTPLFLKFSYESLLFRYPLQKGEQPGLE